MEKITQGHPMTQSPDFVKENIETLKSLFPTIVKEGKIDWSELQALLGNDIETEDEYYRMTWAGKSMARKEANKPSTATLRPNKADSKDWDTTQNIFIEGDNLEVLKLLQKSYTNKIKMIYIDPPYNTGKDFVYKDNYADNLNNYLAITGQLDDSGKRISTNNESDGRFHSNWLNMMYPRLKLARNLLSEQGVMFISIDDNEITNLKKLCDEVFGESNIVGTIANSNNPKGRSDDKFIATAHEYILCYAKSIDNLVWYGFEPTEEIIKRYNKVDSLGKKYREIDLRKTGENDLREDRPNLFYYFYYNETTKDFFPSIENKTIPNYIQIKPQREDQREGNWRWGLATSKEKLSSLIPKFMPTRKVWGIMEKDYLENRTFVKPTSSWTFKDVNSERGSEDFINLGFDKRVFAKPKPIGTISRCVQLATSLNDIILDFFAGSGTTAHAVMQLNATDCGNRKFIAVQLQETCDNESDAFNSGYKNITDIAKERIRRAGEKIKLETKKDLFSESNKTLDIGFKAFKLDTSNINAWDGNPENLEANLFNAGSNIKENRTDEDVLYEILLKNGLDLAQPIEQNVFAGKAVFSVGYGALIICLADGVTTEVAEGIGKWKQELEPSTCKVIFKDNGFTDVEKTNSMQILKRYGIEEVNTI